MDLIRHSCEFSGETPHGYMTVDLAEQDGRRFCEVGMGCLPKCPFAFSEAEESDAVDAFERAIG